MEITEEKKSGVRFLACNILMVRGVFWSFKMGTRMSGKWVNYSYGLAQIKQVG
jgi:hypothetical protein